jgi:hypothetical protein
MQPMCFSIYSFRSSLFALRSLRVLLALCVITTTACRQDMHDQPRFEPLEGSTFFQDGRASRPLVEGTVARGHLHLDEHLYTGKVGSEFAKTFPFEINKEVLERGQQRYNIYCTPCHDKVGSGKGMIVQRGFRPPPSYHIDRLRDAPPGYFFDVITNGFGAMYSYSDRISPEDRWAIIAYIRVLQLSQNATIDDVPEEQRRLLLGN